MATIQEILDRVGDDPDLAQAALDEERASDIPRSTLIAQLETIAAKEAPVSDPTAEATEAPGPEQPVEVELSLAEAGVFVHPVVPRDLDVEVPAEHDLTPVPGEEDVPVNGEQVEWLAAASGTRALALSINGGVYLFNDQMTANLKQIVDRSIVGLSL